MWEHVLLTVLKQIAISIMFFKREIPGLSPKRILSFLLVSNQVFVVFLFSFEFFLKIFCKIHWYSYGAGNVASRIKKDCLICLVCLKFVIWKVFLLLSYLLETYLNMFKRAWVSFFRSKNFSRFLSVKNGNPSDIIIS